MNVSECVEFGIGVWTGVAVTLIGAAAGRRRERRRSSLRPCSCKHGYGFHHADTGKCNHVDSWKDPCYCVNFDGQKPLEEFTVFDGLIKDWEPPK